MTTGEQPTLQELMAKANRMLGVMNTAGGNAQTITVNGAPASVTIGLVVALAVALGCCGYMAGALSGIRAQLEQNQADLRGMQDYINVIYKRTADQKAKEDANRNP